MVGKSAPGSFDNISVEVLSLHAVLKECEETVFARPLSQDRKERLVVIKEGCDKVLQDLQSLVTKYESLGTQSKRTWDRMKWGNEDIAEIRARLTSNITILTAYISSSQSSVETKLDKFIEEFRQGRRENSIISIQTVDSLSADDRTIWRSIRKELEDIGIDLAAFEANRGFIIDWLENAVKTGAFEEDDVVDLDRDSDDQEPWSNEENDSNSSEPQITRSETDSVDQVTKNESLMVRSSSRSAHVVEGNRSKTSAQVPKTPVPLGAALLAAISRPRRRFRTAVIKGNLAQAFKILQDEASFQLLGSNIRNWALQSSCLRGYDNLAAALIARGADVNYDRENGTPLWHAAKSNQLKIVRLLVDNGADFDYTGQLSSVHTERDYAYRNPWPRSFLVRGDLAILQLLLSNGVNVNARYKFQVSYDYSFELGYHSFDHDLNLLEEATASGAVAAMKLLLQYGADVDAVSSVHGTALMLALLKGKQDAAKLLLDKGANPVFKTSSDQHFETPMGPSILYRSPMEAAILSFEPAMISLLLDRDVIPTVSALEFVEKLLSSSIFIYEYDTPTVRQMRERRRMNVLAIRKMLKDALEAAQQPSPSPTSGSTTSIIIPKS